MRKFHSGVSLSLSFSNFTFTSGVIYHEGEQFQCGHYTSGDNLDKTWFLISHTRILRQQKLDVSGCQGCQCSVYINLRKEK